MNGTCPGTPKGTAEGQHRDTNNNDNNIYLFLFNKYKGEFSFLKSSSEKQEIFKKCMQEEKFKELTQEEQTKLYTRLISLV